MPDLPSDYFKQIAEQLVFISVFLGGISATILGTLIISDLQHKLFKWMIICLSLAATSFIVAVIGMNKVLIILAPNSPYENTAEYLDFPRLVGGLAFYIGIYALIAVISISGWLRSKRIGYFTTALGIISGILVLALT